MATLTAGELTNLRTTKHSSKFYLSVLQPTTLLTARVNNVSITRGDRSIAYDTGSGTYASIEAGQTLWVGTSAGDNDVGRIRVKSITGSATSGTITVDENGIDWIDNLHLTILHHYEIWPIPPRIDSGVFYKFYDTTYSNQNSLPNPVAIAGPHQAGFLASGSLIINVPVADSYATTSGATISTTSVSVTPSAGSSVGAEAGGVIPVTYTTAGTRWIKQTTTDSNGKTQSTFRVHFVYDTSTLPYNDFEIGNLGGDWNSSGWQFNATVYGDVSLSDFPDGTIVLLWREGRHDDAETYVNLWTIGDNIVCSGYIRRDSQSDDLSTGDGSVSFTVETPNAVLANRSEMGTVSIEAQTSPGTWYQYASWLTAGRAVHHLLLWHSTTMHTVDVYGLLDNTLGVEVAEFSEDSLLGRVNGFGYTRGIFARMISDRLGRLHFSEDIQMFNETDRAAEDTVFTLGETDLGGDVNVSRESEEQAALSFIDGFSFDGSTATVLISIAGGYIDGSGTSIQVPEPAGSGSINRTRQILNDQTDSNEKCGRLLAAGNNRLKEIRVPMRGDYLGAYDIDPQNGWYNWGVANATLKRQLALNGKLLLPRRVQHDLDVSQGTINSSIIFEAEAFGPDGIPGNYPTSYPTPTLPTPNWTVPTTGCGTVTVNTPAIYESDPTFGPIRITALDATNFIAVWIDPINTIIKGCVIQVSGTTVTPGTPITIATPQGQLSIDALDSTRAICTYVDISDINNNILKAVVLTASGSTLSAGTPQTVEATSVSFISPDITALSSTKAIVAWSLASTSGRACILDISGTTITVNTPAEWKAAANLVSSISIEKLTSTSALIVSFEGGTKNAYGVILHSITTTFTTGTETLLVNETSNLAGSGVGWTVLLDATKFVWMYQIDQFGTNPGLWVHIGTASGTTVTAGDDSVISTIRTANPGIVALDGSTLLIAYWPQAFPLTGNGKVICADVSGNTATVSADGPTDYGTAQTSGRFSQLAKIGSTSAVLQFLDRGDSDKGKAVVVSIV
jgi:hypothetical protein